MSAVIYRSDADYLLDVLSDGEWHEHGEILRRSEQERGCGLTPHSRASDLRKRGHQVKVQGRQLPGEKRRRYFYRLETLNAAEQSVGVEAGESPSGQPNPPSSAALNALTPECDSSGESRRSPQQHPVEAFTLFPSTKGAYGD